jgi:cell division protein FtsW
MLMASKPASPGTIVPVSGAAIAYKKSWRRELSVWWRETDRVLLVLVLFLVAIGAASVAAASPSSARRLSTATVRLDELYFFWLHVRWLALGIPVLIAASLLDKQWARRGAILFAGAMIALLVLVPVIGVEVNGARRWINVLGVTFQPSSFLKPAYPILLAWILTWAARDDKIPVVAISGMVMATICGLLMLQPDFGSTILYAGVWFALMVMWGLAVKRIALAVAGGAAFLAATYAFYPNAKVRIDEFLFGGSEFDQVDLAAKTLQGGGWSGSGFWLGSHKMALPEAHTDYIFSVIGEEFGLMTCIVIILVFTAMVGRVLLRLVEEEDLFSVLAAGGLAVQFGGQAFINILVNLQMFPSKGMPLPLISYGGSSTVAMCASMGLLLALTRRNPFIKRDRFTLGSLGAAQ